MTEEQLQAIKERNQQLLDDGIVLFRQDIETSMELVAEVEQLQSVNKELCNLVGEFAGDVSEFTAQILRKTRHVWREGRESGE